MSMKILGVQQTAFEAIKEKILIGELKGGERLNEINLTKELEISRPPLREAFRLLEYHRLIINLPRRGCYVSKISIEDLEQLLRARSLLEGQAIDIITQGDYDLEPLKKSVKIASSLLPFDDNNEANGLDNIIKVWKTMTDFHYKLISICNDSYLDTFYETISLNLARYQILAFKSDGYRQVDAEEHWKIIQFIEGNEPVKAKEVLQNHIMYLQDSLKINIENLESQ